MNGNAPSKVRRGLIISLVITVGILGYLGRPIDDYASLRKYEPQELWLSSDSILKLLGHPLHCFRFKQPLEILAPDFEMSNEAASSYAEGFKTSDPLYYSDVDPRLKGKAFVALVPSKTPGFSWEARIPEDKPPTFWSWVSRIGRRLGW